MWTLTTPWYELIIRGTCMYFFMFLCIKLWGKKHMGQMTTFDFVLLLFISEAVQNSLISTEMSIFGGMIVIVTFLAWDTIIDKLTFRSHKLESLLDGVPKVIVTNGVPDSEMMRKEQITEQELYRAMRASGVDELRKVKLATLETNGHLSIVEH